MKLLYTKALKGFCLLALATAQSAGASTTIAGDLPARAGEDGQGIAYNFQMLLDTSDGSSSESWNGVLGSKAWSDPSNVSGNLGIPLGWTHTSNWAYISLAAAANVTINLAANASDLVPAFTLWRGADNSGGNFHTYQQDAVPLWIDAAGFDFIRYVTTGPGPYSGQNAALSLFLNAGEYTVAIGGNDTTTAGHQAAYSFSVTAVAPVPLPGAVYLFGSALLGLVGGRRSWPTSAISN
ncbi:hypothetical protein QZJ86_18705 [Methylomonas montana]|uniref:copper(I)-binding protein CorA n=1 Tax=Methylomonas montana TaxID=3058963 RepID=UPI002658DE5C|nr:hypothetical protein [Methylomonas montana]WKJ90014.1 hypothetical protein QZJ86_18705 [Methylomonas montana]